MYGRHALIATEVITWKNQIEPEVTKLTAKIKSSTNLKKKKKASFKIYYV